jgi:hypothetical protein
VLRDTKAIYSSSKKARGRRTDTQRLGRSILLDGESESETSGMVNAASYAASQTEHYQFAVERRADREVSAKTWSTHPATAI